MKFTDKELFFEKKLISKLNLMAKRSTGKYKMDNVLLIDGDEGYGKSNLAVGIAYYFSKVTERSFGIENIFFDIDKMIEFAIKNDDAIIVWDEGALGGLASDWHNKSQKKLTKLLMVARKKRHFWIFNIPKFFKFNDYICVDRSIGLIHVYARNELELGRFIYVGKSKKEKLYFDWKKSRKRNYKFHKDFHGTFSEYLPKIIDENKYDEKKDKAIMSIAESEEGLSVDKKAVLVLRYKVATRFDMTIREIAERMKVSQKSIEVWRTIKGKYPELFIDDLS